MRVEFCHNMFRSLVRSVLVIRGPGRKWRCLLSARTIRNQAFDAAFDQDDLAEARKWHSTFNEKDLPSGQTTFSRSSGPGGQHVNKYDPNSQPRITGESDIPNSTFRTETKATTAWPVQELKTMLPKLMHPALRTSRYYTSRTDSLTIQAQTQRSRTANTGENQEKLIQEIHRIYRETVPQVTSAKKNQKYEAL